MTAAEFGISAFPAPRAGAHPDQAPPACAVRSAPQREPQFDDELAARRLSLVPQLAPELPFPAPFVAANRRRLTLVPLAPLATDTPELPGPTEPPGPKTTTATATERTSGHVGSPDPTRFGRQFAQGVVEVLSGRRPAVQLTRHVSPAVQRGLGRSGAGHQLRSAVAPVLHSLHLTEPAAGVCEMSAIVAVGPRFRAVAARLEWKVDHWLCTALQVG